MVDIGRRIDYYAVVVVEVEDLAVLDTAQVVDLVALFLLGNSGSSGFVVAADLMVVAPLDCMVVVDHHTLDMVDCLGLATLVHFLASNLTMVVVDYSSRLSSILEQPWLSE